MAICDFYTDIDLQKVSSLVNARIQNITTTNRATLAGTLNTNHIGLLVFDIDLLQQFFWSGSVFIAGTGTTTTVSEDEMVYSKRVDFITESFLYKGEATVGSSEAATVWRIRKIVIGTDGDITETWASGSADFSQVWNNRLLLTYS